MDAKSPIVSMEKISAEHEEVQVQSDTGLSADEKRAEKRFLRKADLRIMTMATCIYLLSSLVSLPQTLLGGQPRNLLTMMLGPK